MNNEQTVPHRNIAKFVMAAVLVLGVVFILGMLASTIRKKKENQSRTQCRSNLSQIGKALLMYADVPTSLGRFPEKLEDLYPEYIKDERVFKSPLVPEGQHRKGRGNVKYCDYFYVPGHTDTHGTSGIAFGPKTPSGNGRNLLLGAGSVEWIDFRNFGKRIIQDLEDNGLIQTLKNGRRTLLIPPNATPAEKAYFEAFAQELGLK